MTLRTREIGRSFLAGALFSMLVLMVFVIGSHVAAEPATAQVKEPAPAVAQSQEGSQPLSVEERLQRLQNSLSDVTATIKIAEIRSYENKMMSRELVRFVRFILVVLIVIAVGFPVVIWLLSRKRILGLSGLSDEVAATLLSIEERQSKLAAILREIQGEMDYLHSSASPDLKNLVAQAGKYLEDSERDLKRAGLGKGGEGPASS